MFCFQDLNFQDKAVVSIKFQNNHINRKTTKELFRIYLCPKLKTFLLDPCEWMNLTFSLNRNRYQMRGDKDDKSVI